MKFVSQLTKAEIESEIQRLVEVKRELSRAEENRLTNLMNETERRRQRGK